MSYRCSQNFFFWGGGALLLGGTPGPKMVAVSSQPGLWAENKEIWRNVFVKNVFWGNLEGGYYYPPMPLATAMMW